MGKTRLAAELAGEAHRDGAAVLYAAGTGAPEAALAVARTRTRRSGGRRCSWSTTPTARPPRCAPRCASSCPRSAALRSWCSPRACRRRRSRGSSRRSRSCSSRSTPTACGRSPPSTRRPTTTARSRSRRCSPRAAASRAASTRRRASGRGARRRDASTPSPDRTAAGRSEARALEAELAGSVVELQSARERAGLVARDGDDDDAPMVCPYKGLATFDADDAEYFFGRERLVAELVARLVGAPLLAVVGPSGSGKSSVMRAGLLPALAGGVLPGQRELDAGGDPPRRAAAARAAPRDPPPRRASGAACWRSTSSRSCSPPARTRPSARSSPPRSSAPPAPGTVVVLAVRADFYGRCAAYPELSRLLGANHVLVGPMSRDELGRAIERPAQRVGLSVEPELVESLLARRRGPARRAAAAVDRAARALARARRAAPAPRRLRAQRRRPRRRRAARRGGLRRARTGRAGRRRARCCCGCATRTRAARSCAAGSRSTSSEPRRGGGRRAARRPPAADGLRRRRRGRARGAPARMAAAARLARRGRRTAGACTAGSSDAARAWDADARDPGGLYRGARLAAALDWAAGHDVRAQRDRARLPRRQPARERARPAPAAHGPRRRRRAARPRGDRRRSSRSTSAATRAPRRPRPRRSASAPRRSPTDDLDRALLLARQGVALDDSAQTRSNLLATLLKSPAAIGVMGGDGDPLTEPRPEPRRTHAGVRRRRRGALAASMRSTRRPLARAAADPRPHGASCRSSTRCSFSDDGSRLAVGGWPAGRPGCAPACGRSPSLRTSMARRPRVRFSPDGRTLVAAVEFPSGGQRRCSASTSRTGERLGEPRQRQPPASNS